MTNNLNGYLVLKNTHNLPVSMLHGFWLFIQQSLLNSLAMRFTPDLRRGSNIFVSSAVKCRAYCYHLTLCLFQHLQRQQYFLLFYIFFLEYCLVKICFYFSCHISIILKIERDFHNVLRLDFLLKAN